ncbi:MAG TPA: hypothetical protein VF571_20345 [Pyrinomonadaceae bacterium]|jgi:hypothetical protein
MWKPDWTRRDKTHLLIIPRERFAEQTLLTYALAPSAVVVDWREEFLREARPTQKRLSLTVAGEIDRLTRIGNRDKRIYSIINTEYLLAGFDERTRDQFWRSLWSDFPHLKGILLFTVLDAPAMLPDKLTLADWQADGRLFRAGSK